jgi:hypothetical protein
MILRKFEQPMMWLVMVDLVCLVSAKFVETNFGPANFAESKWRPSIFQINVSLESCTAIPKLAKVVERNAIRAFRFLRVYSRHSCNLYLL